MNLNKKHYAPLYFANPEHRITVCLIGCGGTGSHVLTNLARINYALEQLGHPGLLVWAIDPDTVSESNVGRQHFSNSDIGRYKSDVLIERINRFFNLNWISTPILFKSFDANITISCVDTISSRELVFNNFCKQDGFLISKTNYKPFDKPYYWLDFGNGNTFGQFILGSHRINQNGLKNTNGLLPTFFDYHSANQIKEDKNEPSCSMREALLKQDLFINSLLAQLGCNLLWKLLHDKVIDYHGGYLNIGTNNLKPIKIP